MNRLIMHPAQTLKIIFVVIVSVWQSIVAIVGILLYILTKNHKKRRITLMIVSVILLIFSIIFKTDSFSAKSIAAIFVNGFKANVYLFKLLQKANLLTVMNFIYDHILFYVLGFCAAIAAVLHLLDLIPSPPHLYTIKNLVAGVKETIPELNEKTIEKRLKSLNDEESNGTLLGVNKITGHSVIIPDKHVNQVVLVMGTTGGGKTITLRRFYQRVVLQNYPLIIVDGKPDVQNILNIKKLAEKYNKPFFGFNCDEEWHYDPLHLGGFTELKDKIICLKDEWENDYYRSIAEDYLQTTLQVLLKSELALDLKLIVQCLNYKELVQVAAKTQDTELMKRVNNLSHYDMKDIKGLQAHLNILIHSELGKFFEKNDKTFSLTDVLKQKGVAYFALPALRFPSFSKVLGKLVINDIKAVIDRDINQKPIFTVFDEFSVFAGEQVLNLVNMGRGKGIHAIFGTQGLADLERVDKAFKSQVLNCANTLICHRLNDEDSAETVANWVGTQDAFTVTAQLNVVEGNAQMGSVRTNKEFIIHPDTIKQELNTGEAFYITKVDGFRWEKVRVKFD